MPIYDQQVLDLFDRVSLLAEDKRDEFLEQNCSDPESRNVVLKLLEEERRQCSAGSKSSRKPVFPKIPGFEILGRLGEGGMGVVYKAQCLDTRRVVAIKILSSVNSRDQDIRRRFKQEARAISAIDHDRVVKIKDIGEFDDRPFIVLEFVDGPTLADKIGKPWQPKEAATFVRDLALAVAAVHEKGIIHRDLKPGNVLIDRRTGIAKVADFGLAKLQSQNNLTRQSLEKTKSLRTMTGAIMGTPAYMAPEQALGQNRRISAATDVYALGAILYELLCGHQLFESDCLLEKLDKVRGELPVFPDTLTKVVSTKDLVTICFKCLEKDPSKRYQTAKELADDLERFEKQQPIIARRSRNGQNRRGIICWLAAAICVCIVFPFAALNWNDSNDNQPQTTIAIKGFPGYAPLYVAKEMGLLENVKFKEIDKVNQALELLTNGDVDVALCLPESLMFARKNNMPLVAVLKMDQSMDDCIVVKPHVNNLNDLIKEQGVTKKILIQDREPSNTLLLGIISALGILPDQLEIFSESAGQAVRRFKYQDDVWAVGSYPPHTGGLKTLYTAASAKAEFPNDVIDVTDIMVVRESYLETDREMVEMLLDAWFTSVEMLTNPDAPGHEEALAHGANFMVKYGNPGYTVEMLLVDLSGVVLADEKANRKFFSVDEYGNSNFRSDLERARGLYNRYTSENIGVFEPAGDRSDFMFEHLANLAFDDIDKGVAQN